MSATILVPCTLHAVSAETRETETEASKVYIQKEELKETVPELSQSLAKEPIPITEKTLSEDTGTITKDDSSSDEEADKENTSPLNQNWPEQVFSSISETMKYLFTTFMSEIQKEIDLYSYKEEVNNTENTEYNETAVTIKEPPTNETQASNSTLEASSLNDAEKNESSLTKPRFHCTGKNITENSTGAVQMVNGTTLLQRLAFENNASGSECILVFFYAPWCHFSALAASSYNTLGRAFPQLDIMAVDAVQFSNLNARFGVVSVPNIIFFHQSKSVVRFNSSKKTFENMVLFVKNMTGLEADKSVEVSEQDLIGPISSIPTSEPDYLLWLAWTFISVCSLSMFYASSLGQQLINKIHTLWQEHQHIE